MGDPTDPSKSRSRNHYHPILQIRRLRHEDAQKHADCRPPRLLTLHLVQVDLPSCELGHWGCGQSPQANPGVTAASQAAISSCLGPSTLICTIFLDPAPPLLCLTSFPSPVPAKHHWILSEQKENNLHDGPFGGGCAETVDSGM